MKNKKKEAKKNFKISFLTLAFSALIFLGLGIAFQTFFIKEKGKVAGEQYQKTGKGLESLRDKLGQDAKYFVDPNTDKVTFISAEGKTLPLDLSKLGKLSPQKVSWQFLREYGAYFGVREPMKELKAVHEREDKLKMTHVTYGQRYKKIPVFGGEIQIHLSKNLSVVSANGRIAPNIKVSARPKISREKAEEKAKNLWEDQFGVKEAETLSAEKVIFSKGLVENKKDDRSYLTWKIELFNQNIFQHEFYFINARNGKLIYQITGKRDLNRRIADCSLGSCVLDYFFLGYTYGRSEGQPARGANPWYGGTDVDDLYDITWSMNSFISARFSLNGGNNQGGIGDGSNSAYTNTDGYTYIDYATVGICPNAFFDDYYIAFCQGYEVTDIVGHEYGHAINFFSVLDGYGNPSGLLYANESGALNESHSDVMGEALEYYRNGSSDWLIGEGLSGGASRSMSDPASISYSLDGQTKAYPDRFNSSNVYCGSSDEGGVHVNSTVPSHAAYLMAAGGSFNGCTISAIGKEKEEKIAYRAYNVYMITSSNFNSAYNAFNSACNDLYGSGSAECTQAKKALQAVQMDKSGYCNGDTGSVSSCAAPTISGVENGVTYSSSVTPTFSHGTATLNGASFSSGTTISANGDYTLIASNDYGDSTSVQFTIRLISTDTPTLAYSRKKSTKKRINITVSGVTLSKKKGVKVRLGGRKTTVVRVRNLGNSTLVSIKVKYGKWPVGSYDFYLSYNQKIKKTRLQGSASASGLLLLIQ